MAMKLCTKLDVVWERCPIVFQGHLSKFKVTRDKKITAWDPNLAFPDCNSSLNWSKAMKRCTKLDVGKIMRSIVFQISRSRGTKSQIFTPIWRFRTVTPVRIDRWLWNDAQSLKWHWRGDLFFSWSSVKFQGDTGTKKIADFHPNCWRFWTVTPAWIDRWLWNYAQSSK